LTKQAELEPQPQAQAQAEARRMLEVLLPNAGDGADDAPNAVKGFAPRKPESSKKKKGKKR